MWGWTVFHTSMLQGNASLVLRFPGKCSTRSLVTSVCKQTDLQLRQHSMWCCNELLGLHKFGNGFIAFLSGNKLLFLLLVLINTWCIWSFQPEFQQSTFIQNNSRMNGYLFPKYSQRTIRLFQNNKSSFSFFWEICFAASF